MMNLSEQDSTLLDAARIGDPVALESLLRLCQPDIRRYAQRHCMISDIDDAVQESMLILARKLDAIRVLAAFSGWMFRVVQRECRRLGRIALRYDPYEEEKLENWLVARNTDQLRLELIQTLESLPQDYREIILLRDFEELTISEIASELQLSTAATKSRLHRARLMAREYLLAES
ncbi:RNA polymerase sigma factor [Undibacterium sp. RuTC16W]|uniref:RNA polymerase sigma factor n=1 Tax=Undibacterium sp. RuTC16W TaxID=3413048 RepID=UPI003BF12AC4